MAKIGITHWRAGSGSAPTLMIVTLRCGKAQLAQEGYSDQPHARGRRRRTATIGRAVSRSLGPAVPAQAFTCSAVLPPAVMAGPGSFIGVDPW
jgi:hypothetical protein